MGKLNRRNFCWCHCGFLAKPGKKFIYGHTPKPIPNHHLCECPCGELVASNRRFVNGHNWRGFHLTEEQLKRRRGPRGPMSEEGKLNIKIGHNTPEAKKNHSKAGIKYFQDPINRVKNKAAQNTPEAKANHSKAAKITQNQSETKEKQSQTNVKPEVKERRSRSAKTGNSKPGVKEKQSQLRIKYFQDPINRVNLSKIMIKYFQDPINRARNKARYTPEVRKNMSIIQNRPEVKAKNSQSVSIAANRPEARAKNSQLRKEFWADPVRKANQLLAISKGLDIRPNKPETFLSNNFIYWLPKIIYSGDYSIIINGKNPDFICEETKKIIEFNGSYWHKNDIPGAREAIFAEAGYDTLIIWEHELKDIDILKIKVDAFMMKENPYAKIEEKKG